MEKKKVLKFLLLLVLIVTVLVFVYNLFLYLSYGNTNVDISLNENFDSGRSIEGVIKVFPEKSKTGNSLTTLKSKVKISLLDSNGKKVKGTNVEKYSCEATEDIIFDYKIPEEIEPGSFTMRFDVSSKKGFERINKTISIQNSKSNNLIISFDKGIYKPGDIVNFRGMLLSKKDNTPEEMNINVSIYDGNDNRVYNENTKTSEYGITSGSFKLADEVNSGTYRIVFCVENEEFSKSFIVNPYITPKYGVELIKSSENLKVGDEGIITVSCKYFFGEPVKNAKVELKIDDKEELGITNDEGVFEYSFIPQKEGISNFDVKVTDESNYVVEEKTEINCSNEAFKVEIVPEYSNLIAGVNNNIFVITKKIDGTPLKTYATITSNTFSRQVITDENGIGKFMVSANDFSNLYILSKGVYFDLSIKNMNDEVVDTKMQVGVSNLDGVLVKTDNVIYNQGEDIEIGLESDLDLSSNTIYIIKNSNIIRTITTDQTNTKVNLDDEYGLISIATLDNNGNYFNYKKTIFIKPTKGLDVNIETDSEEYKPGDDIKLDLNLKDENGDKVDGAILVSIIDEAIQSLSKNDLNIDNLMLALNDLELSGGMDLASIYAEILDEKDDILLTTMLIKQKPQMPNLYKFIGTTYNEEYGEKAVKAVLFSIVLFVLYLLIKSKNTRNVLGNIVTFINLLLLFFPFSVLVTYLFKTFEILGIVFGFEFLLLLIIYANNLKDKKKKIWIYILGICVIPFLLAVCEYCIFERIWNYIDSEEGKAFLIALGLLILSFVIVKVLSKKMDDKNALKGKIIVSIVIALFTGFNDDIVGVGLLLNYILFVYYMIDLAFFNNSDKKENKKTDGKNVVISIDKKALIVIGLSILVIVGYKNITNNFANQTISDIDPYSRRDYSDNFNTDTSLYNYPESITTIDTSGAAASTPSFTDASSVLSGLFSNKYSRDVKDIVNEDVNKTNASDEKVSIEDDNVRDIFLDSLSFIPDIVTENGKASEEIKLSDNITTWQIQAVANTKDGRVGYGSKDIKVFKEFFVDFSLPTNSVVGDKMSIPVTVYNYTKNDLNVNLNIEENTWLTIGDYEKQLTVGSEDTYLVYVPIEILKDGKNKFRVEASSNSSKDIMELSLETKPNGVMVSKVVSSGTFENKMDLDILQTESYLDGTNKLSVKLYPSTMSAVLENIDNILKMPTGCFEQTSSSLYPDVLALRYIKENNISNETLKKKANEYINSGYQRLLTFEVKTERGGFSLYGHTPAEPILTSYGLMELKEVSDVYEIDEKVLDRMKDYLFSKQNLNGSFKINDENSYFTSHTVSNKNEFTLNAYITWAMSEAFPDDNRLKKSVEYLENNLDKITDDYTLALVANVFANTHSSKTDSIIKKLNSNVKLEDNNCYFESNVYDYWGSRGNVQNIQTTALASMAYSKTGSNTKTNKAIIDYLISKRDKNGTWNSTQATVLSLKALVTYSKKAIIDEQEIKVKLNGEEKTENISKNSLDLYELNFDNLQKENKLSLENQNGELFYEVIADYYTEYDEFMKRKQDIDVETVMTGECNVNDIVKQNIKINNNSGEDIYNGMVVISIPQGCSVKEESLSKLETLGIIQKYEYNYGTINLYLRNFEKNTNIELEVDYKANYPENITGGMVRIYDYYNPDIEGYSMPMNLSVK